MPRISKVKAKDGLVQVVEISGEGTREESETTHKVSADPHPDFRNAMADLVMHVRDILEWPDTYAPGRIRITGVSFSMSESTGVEGATISGLVDLEKSNSPFSFNTPHLPFDQYNDGGTAPVMPDDAIDALEKLRAEASEFIHKGKRSQGDLFAPSNENEQPAAAH